MISRLDRYVARYFFTSWVVSAVFFLGLHAVYVLFAEFNDLLKGFEVEGSTHGFLEVAELFLLRVPMFFVQVAPFIMVMAALITLLRLQRHNEFMAMIMTGRSARRVILPIFALTIIFLGGLVWVQEVWAPEVSLQRDELQWSLTEKGKDRMIETMNMRDAEGRLFSAFNYNVGTGVISRLNMSYEDGFGRNVHVTGQDAQWNDEAGGWTLQNGRSEVRRSTSEESKVEEAFFVETDIRPEQLLAESRLPFDLSYSELLGLSERYPSSRRYRLLRHYHVTFPLSVLLLVLLSVPFVVRLEASRRTRGLGIAIGCCMAFLILDASLRDLGSRGIIQPVLAAWLPVIVAGSLATVLHDSLES